MLNFVGTYKKRKRLDRLVALAARMPSDIEVKIVGGGMEILQSR